MTSDLKSAFLKAALGKPVIPPALDPIFPQADTATLQKRVQGVERVQGARFGNITIFPDDAAPPHPHGDTQALLAHGRNISVPDTIIASDASGILLKPVRRRGAGAKTWRPNPSFPMDDYSGMVESASHHGMSVGSFIVTLCQAYIYCSPFILTQHLRPSMPPMTAEEYRTFSGMANNLNQIARVMNEGRKTSLAYGSTYPDPPEDLNALLQAIYVLLRVSR